jgi:hypothetical protein
MAKIAEACSAAPLVHRPWLWIVGIAATLSALDLLSSLLRPSPGHGDAISSFIAWWLGLGVAAATMPYLHVVLRLILKRYRSALALAFVTGTAGFIFVALHLPHGIRWVNITSALVQGALALGAIKGYFEIKWEARDVRFMAWALVLYALYFGISYYFFNSVIAHLPGS